MTMPAIPTGKLGCCAIRVLLCQTGVGWGTRCVRYKPSPLPPCVFNDHCRQEALAGALAGMGLTMSGLPQITPIQVRLAKLAASWPWRGA